ncbi:MAG: hypothetical protein J7647_08745 [Cyanobacteria bacterium SBLK]|nr:hypothetical protein [Cyanobacteria bacterium SBLK]
MKALRWFFSILLALILAIALIFFLPATAIVQQITNVQTVKTWFNESNAYDEFLAAALQEKLQDAIPQLENLPLGNNRQIFTAIAQSLPDDFVQNLFETVLDAHFNYFHGRKDRVEFTIDLTNIANSLNPNISNLPTENNNTPPILPPGNPPTPPPIDPSQLNSSQLPGGISEQLTITEEDIELDYNNLANIRQFFSIATLIPRLSYGLILLLSIFILAIASPRWRNGLFVLGFTWLPSTILVVLLTLGARSPSLNGIQTQLNSTIVQEDPAAGNLLLQTAIVAHASIIERILFLSGVGVLLGVIFLAIAFMNRRISA